MRFATGVRIRGSAAAGLLLAAAAAWVAGISPAIARSAPTPLTGTVFTIAGALRWTGPRDESSLAGGAAFENPAVAALPNGGFLIVDNNGGRLLRVSPSGHVSTVLAASTGQGTGTPTLSLTDVGGPGVLAALPGGGCLIADSGNNRVVRVSPDGRVSTVAGNGNFGFSGDNGPATEAELASPMGVAALPDGGFLIADTYNHRVRRVWPDGRISTVAGDGKNGHSGDGGPATLAKVADPEAVAALPDGGFLIADFENARVLRVWPDGHISTVAGNGRLGDTGDGGPATAAAIDFPDSLAAVPGGGFLIGTDNGVRQVGPTGTISTVMRPENSVFSGDGGPASLADLYAPGDDDEASVAVLPDGSRLIGYGKTVRLVVGPRKPQLLAAAMEPLSGVGTATEYRASVVLTHPAALTLRVYRSRTGRPLVTVHAQRPAGQSTVVVNFGGHLTPGLYAVDLRARSGSRTTRAELYVYLGGSVTTRSIQGVVNGLIADEDSGDPNAVITVGRCQQFGALRVDCSIFGDENYVMSVTLTSQGQLSSRSYYAPIVHQHRVFELNPQWNGPPAWDDLGGAWFPYSFSY